MAQFDRGPVDYGLDPHDREDSQYGQIVTSLNPSHGKWSRWAVPTEKVATTFMRWMRRPPAV